MKLEFAASRNDRSCTIKASLQTRMGGGSVLLETTYEVDGKQVVDLILIDKDYFKKIAEFLL